MEKRIFNSVIRAVDGEQGVTHGTVPYCKKSVYMGFVEELLPRCFSTSLKQVESGERNIYAFHNHDSSLVLGSTKAGTLTLRDTPNGLEYTIYHNLDQSFSKDAWLMYKSDICTTSFGMRIIESRRSSDGIEQIVEAELIEVSPTPMAAYPDSSVSARIQNQNKSRGNKMSNSRYTHGNFDHLLNEIERLEPTEVGVIPDGYLDALSEFREVQRVVHPNCPDVRGLEGIGAAGIRRWVENLPGMPGGIRHIDERYHGNGAQIEEDDTRGETRAETAYAQRTNTKEYRKSYNRYLVDGSAGISPSELRALQVDSDTAGGYIVAPQKMANQLVKALDAQVFIRGLATKYPVPNAVSLGIPVLDNDPADSDWTSELGTGSEDSTMSFGKRELNPHPLAKRIKVSNKLLRASTLNAGSIVESRLIYKFAVTEEKAFLTGNGNNQPLGVFTASNDGISTSRDVSEDNTTTAITTDGLIEAFHGLRPQYQKNATWIFHPDTIKMVRKLKDGDGQYIFSPGIMNGIPATILGRPFFLSEFAPNTFTTGQYVGIVGDFSFYWIADALKMQIQRLIELYAETNQTGFIGRLECDGMPTLEEAFSRITLG